MLPLSDLKMFRRWSSWKLLLPTVGVSGLLMMVVAVAAWQLDRLQESSAQTVAINVSAMKAAEELEIVIRDVRHRLHLFLITRERATLADLPRLRHDLENWLAETRKVATTEIEQTQISRVERDYARLSPAFDRLTAQANSAVTRDNDLVESCRTLALDEMHGMLDAAHEYLDFNEHAITESSQRNQVFTDRLVPILFFLGLCGAAAGVFVGFGFARGLRRRVIECNVPIHDAVGSLSEVVGPVSVSTALDLDELEPALRRMAEQVERVVRRLQESERETLRAEQLAAVGQLAAGLAHELRNPLTSMKVLVQTAQGDESQPLEGRDLSVLEEEIARMSALIESFLEYARPPQLEKRPADIVELCEQAILLVVPRAAQKGVRIMRLLGPPLLAEVDARQLRQVLLNLFENALDATSDGNQIWVELLRCDESPPPLMFAPWDKPLVGRNGTVATSHTGHLAAGFVIVVADDGCGLPDELGENIFQPFVSTKETGMGLGLSICRRIIQAHDGQITATKLSGGGSAFTIWLPCGPKSFATTMAQIQISRELIELQEAGNFGR